MKSTVEINSTAVDSIVILFVGIRSDSNRMPQCHTLCSESACVIHIVIRSKHGENLQRKYSLQLHKNRQKDLACYYAVVSSLHFLDGADILAGRKKLKK